ncbi:MAG: AAA family ATPase, partial [bacterium]|nr:AAA family ATPase [bacterium]
TLQEWKTKQKVALGQFYGLSDKIITFNPGHVLLLAGTSGTGKTNAAIQLCEDICECNNEEWLFMSLEMAKHDVDERCAKIRFYENNPDGTRYESNMFFDQNKDNPTFYDHVAANHMNICDKTGITIDQIKAIVKYEVTKNPKIKTVVIDYAQLIRGKGSIFERMTHISEVCPLIGKEYGVRVVLLCQLTKDSYDNQRPTPSSIKGSGALFDNADIVLCLYKDLSIHDNRVLEWLHWKDRPNGST